MLAFNGPYYFFAHVTSKSSKGKRLMENNAQPGQATRDAVNLVLTPLIYSQQMMVRDCYIVYLYIILCDFCS